ncbi:MAG: mechanosensitive ion channel [Myxococcales bacterium]|nr:MAG: mechanosensitive ion channel [Myxococcales bacterium]
MKFDRFGPLTGTTTGTGPQALVLTPLAELLARSAVRGSYLGPLLLAAVRVGEALVQALIDSGTLDASRLVRRNGRQCMAVCQRVLRFGGMVIWIYLILNLMSAREPFVSAVGALLGAELDYGPVVFSFGSMLAFGATLWGTWVLSRFLSFSLEEEIFPRVTLPPGIPFALATFTRYIVLVIGFTVAMAMLGFNVDRLALLFSALGVGIGFGLQNVTNNFVSGIIMLFERPVRVGDSVQLDALTGEVTQIGIRASIIRTWDGADVMVPNGEFISARLTNWTFADRKRRIILPVGVAYGTEPERVIAILEELAAANEEVLADPEPYGLFTGFGDSSLDFELRAWTDSRRGWQFVRSDLAVAVERALAAAEIVIPFPQHDLHVRSRADPGGGVIAKAAGAATGAGGDETARPVAVTDAPDDVDRDE